MESVGRVLTEHPKYHDRKIGRSDIGSRVVVGEPGGNCLEAARDLS